MSSSSSPPFVAIIIAVVPVCWYTTHGMCDLEPFGHCPHHQALDVVPFDYSYGCPPPLLLLVVLLVMVLIITVLAVIWYSCWLV